MVVLQNERSASDAEMFPDGFRALGLGKLVGVPTSGQVIGTGSFTLLDGSAIRTPGAGVFTAKGENMENYGVPPDVYVDNTPADFLGGTRSPDRKGDRDVEDAEVGVARVRIQRRGAENAEKAQRRQNIFLCFCFLCGSSAFSASPR